ncbi:MAG: hypothetical protein ACE367_24590 [Acidimicrobiales bacterium]
MRTDDSLDWLNTVLWPCGDGGFVRADESVSDGLGRCWWASPGVENPHTLVPTAPRRAARRSARRYHDGKPWPARARVLAAEVAMGSPLTPAVGPFAQRISATGLDRGVIGALREEFGQDLVFAVTLASPKSNRKAVLQLLAPDGECVGFAKVSPDPWNDRLLANEAAWLARAAPPSLRVPAVRRHGEAGGRMVLVQEAVLPPRMLRRGPVDSPPVHLFDDVAAMGTRRRASVDESSWMGSVRTVLDHADPADRLLLEHALAAHSAPLELGAWHGDLASWNLYTGRDAIAVIDWEFAADDVPLGFDVCHFHLQVANELLGLDAASALRWARERIADPLVGLGVEPREHAALWRLYLVELVRRSLALRAGDLPITGVRHGVVALDYLRAISPTPTMEVVS